MKKEAIVLRYGHRLWRDERVTTHCCLVARAFGAKKIIIVGETQKDLEDTVTKIVEKWGNGFKLEFTNSWTKSLGELKKQGFTIIHLTMYGVPINKIQKKLKGINRVCFVIGAKKVERKVFEESSYNVSIGTQPHSEIAALAIALDRFFSGKELEKSFSKAKLKIIPRNRGKKVEKIQ